MRNQQVATDVLWPPEGPNERLRCPTSETDYVCVHQWTTITHTFLEKKASHTFWIDLLALTPDFFLKPQTAAGQ